MKYEHVLSPIKIGSVELRNRMVVPPMGTNFATRQGFVTQQMLDYYEARAKGGFGLIDIEVTAVVPQGRSIPNELGVWSDEHIEGLSKLAEVIHRHGAKTIVQLHHCGRETFPETINDGIAGKDLQVESCSAVPCPFCNTPVREMTNQDCYDMIDRFVEAAVRCQKAGFDGVQLHCTHGYLLAQFMSRHANKRVDEFGGSIAGRMKMPLDILKKIKQTCGKDFVVTVRMTGDERYVEGIEPEEATVMAKMFEDAGADALHVSVCTYASLQYMSVPGHVAPGYNVYTAEKVKQYVKSIPVCTVGRINDPDLAEMIIATGKADLVALGRESICDPEIPNKMKEDRAAEISPCIACEESCHGYLFGPHTTISCLVNPMTGNEGKYSLAPAAVKKHVVIIGAGPAGLVAAWNAAAKGHSVDLYDSRDYVGGEFKVAAIPPGKQAIAKAIYYYKVMCDKYGVRIHLNTPVDEAMLRDMQADVFILATGSKPAMPPIPGLAECKIKTTTSPVLEGKVNPGQKVLIAGGGFMAAEVAEFLLEHGKDVTIVEMRDSIAADAHMYLKPFIYAELNGMNDPQKIVAGKCTQLLNAKIREFTPDGVVYAKDGKLQVADGFDTIIVALGVKANNPLEEIAKKYHDNVIVIGDATGTGLCNQATEAGLAAAMSL